MRFFIRILAFAATAAPFLAQAVPLTAAPLLLGANSTNAEVVLGRYIITLDPATDAASVTLHHNKVREIYSRNLARRDVNNEEDPGEGVDKTYELGDFKGYAGSFDAATIEELIALPEVCTHLCSCQLGIQFANSFKVLFVEPDIMMYTSALVTQEPAPWGLGSISARDPINSNGFSNYIYDSTAGANTWSYIIGESTFRTFTSSELLHADYHQIPASEHRMSNLKEGLHGATTQCLTLITQMQTSTERKFYPTHGISTAFICLTISRYVAAIVGGKTYGVAKKTNLIVVKVFDIAGGFASHTIDGLQWAANDIVVKGRTGTAVINMSFGGGALAAMDRAVAAAYAQGVMSVSCAMNDDRDANNVSPARAPEGICVGAISSNNKRSSFSNWGSVVDIWAPESQVLSAWGSGDTDTMTASGTSASSPFVAGLISYIRGMEGAMRPDEVRRKVIGYATQGKVTDPKGGANLIAYNNNGQR
jgi:oryzin